MIGEGDAAPFYSLPSSLGHHVSSADYVGRWYVLYFYFKAFTPNCSREATFFQNNAPALRELGVDVVGISMDSLPTQCEFAKDLSVTYPLLADTNGDVCRAFGVRWPLLPLVRRVTFVIGPDTIVRAAFHHELQVVKQFDPILRFVREAVVTGQHA